MALSEEDRGPQDEHDDEHGTGAPVYTDDAVMRQEPAADGARCADQGRAVIMDQRTFDAAARPDISAGDIQVGVTRPGAASGPLLLADISGYSGFLSAVTDAHRDDAFADGRIPDAYGLVSSLLDGIIASIVPPFELAKLEGDAVFAYSPTADGFPRGEAVLDRLAACYTGFRERLGGAKSIWTCRCDACARVEGLDLKFVLHAGAFVIAPMGGANELVGSEVVMVHRLLKNGASELVGTVAYALFTDAAARMLEIPPRDAVPITEQYEHLPPITARVLPLARLLA